jgi:flagellar biosynthetic protein FlhB
VSGKQDRTEAPTPRRKRESRRDGRIARSHDIPSWTAILIASFIVPSMLRNVGNAASDSVRALQDLPAAPEPTDAVDHLSNALRQTFVATLPLLLIVAAVLIASNLAQVGLVLTGKPLKPKFSRLNPASGFKQMFSTQSLWDTGKSIVRIGLLALIAVPAVTSVSREVLEQGNLDLSRSIPMLAGRVLSLVRLFAVLALVLAAVDYLVARRRINKQVRMTKQEVKEEYRNTEGDPHIKAKLKSLRRMFSQNRLIAAAGDADALIVNPTHFAVAVKYDRKVGVPVVVARGSDRIALQMREVAQEAAVPIVEEKPLARALYWACEVGDSIPRELFEGVARVLAFVYSLPAAYRPTPGSRSSSASGATRVLHLPSSVASSIPDEVMQPGARQRARAEARRAKARTRAENQAQRDAQQGDGA